MPNSFHSFNVCTLSKRELSLKVMEMMVGIGIVLGYMGLLYFGAMISPGVGLSGQLMVQFPVRLFDWAHALGYGLLAMLLTRGLQRRGWPQACALPVAAAAALVFGLWTEVFQGAVPGRHSSVDDLVMDAVGIGLAAMMTLSREFRSYVHSGDCVQARISRLT